MDRAARDDRAVAARPSSRGQARGADRPRPSRRPDSAQLRRQEHPHRARRARTGAPRAARGRTPGRAKTQDRVVIYSMVESLKEDAGETHVMSRILLRGGRLIDPARAIDGDLRRAGRRGRGRGARVAGPARHPRGRDGHRRDRMLGGAGARRSARSSARSRLSARRKRSRPGCARRRPVALPRWPRWRTPRRSTTVPR